uniref:Uncharacterized protein n=1 Tax=Meloidogyne enterolobii TaxID=390850 RepID=A0A6V7WHW1_MELEN|nr:unnamed protein product [Meloidogyne enterolobii]
MAEFPKIEAPFIGYISETKRQSDLDPTTFDVEMKNIGYYEHLPTSIIEEKHGKLEKFTQFFKGTKNVGDFPLDSEPYSGPIASTNTMTESKTEPLHSLVSVYSSGRYDEAPSEIPPKIIKQTEIETQFATKVQAELEGIPLDIEKKHVGYYDQLSLASSMDEKKKPGRLEKLTKLFKRSKNEGEFPFDSEPFVGEIKGTQKMSELATEPIHSMVSIYSSGRSDEVRTTKITEFPVNEAPFVGNVHEVIRHSEIETSPLEVEAQHNHLLVMFMRIDFSLNWELPLDVEKKHLGYYESLTKTSEYPKHEEPFIGHIYSLQQNEVESVPLEVEHKHIGYYDHLPSDEEKKPGALEKLTKLFKGSKTEGEFPVDSEPYFGPLKETKVVSEATGEPIHSLVSVYSSGRSDEIPTARIPTESVEEPSAHYLFETERNSDLPEYQLNNLVNVYSSGHSDETKITKFPINEAPFVGNVHEIKRQECETLPLEFEMKNVGYYEHLPSVTTEEGKKPGLLDKITHLFKEDVRSDYPQVTAPFSGHVFETNHPTELYASQIEQHVNVYSSGRSDEIPKTTEYPIETSYSGHVSESKRLPEIDSVPLEIENKHIGYYENLPTTAEHSEKKLGTLEKLTHFLKGSKTTEEFPFDSEPYVGTMQRIEATSEAPNEPIHAFVSVYSSGRSDEVQKTKTTEFPINEAPFVDYVPESKLHSGIEHIPLDLEKKHVGYYEQLPSTSSKTFEYPKHDEPFIGHIHSLQLNEVETVPIEVENKHIGYYEHLLPTNDEEKKPGALEKLSKLFKGSKTDGDYPSDSEPYIGQISTTNILPELPEQSLHSFANVYSSGRSDEIPSKQFPEHPNLKRYSLEIFLRQNKFPNFKPSHWIYKISMLVTMKNCPLPQ